MKRTALLRSFPFLVIAFGVVLVVEAQDSGEAEPQPEAGNVTWIEEMLSREAEPLDKRHLASPDKRFETRVAALHLATTELPDGDFYFQLGVGTDTPVECYVFPDGHDLAASQQLFTDETFKFVSSNFGEIETKILHRIDAGDFNGHPFIALDWLYRIATPEGATLGQLKHLGAFTKFGASVHCLHNEIGYGSTFERVVHGFVENLRLVDSAAMPYYREIHRVSLGETPVGVSRVSLAHDADGDTRVEERLSMLIPLKDQTLMTLESYNIQHSSPDGQLLNAVGIDLVNGEIVTQLALEPAPEETWKVSGIFESENYETTLASAEVVSTLGEMLVISNLVTGAKAGDETSMLQWTSSEPASFSKVRVLFDGPIEADFRARLDLGDSVLSSVFDANGSLKSGALKVAALEMKLERIHAAGDLSARQVSPPAVSE